MSDKEAQELKDELAQAWTDKVLAQQAHLTMQQEAVRVGALLEKTSAELAQASEELDAACVARDVLARECNQLEEAREYNAALVMRQD
ncbi:MAG: hypothetical protein E3J25_09335, partial [Anaerolineales bacterium]